MKPLNRNTAGLPVKHPVKVLQFGEGNFLRAFVDWIIDILNEKADFNASVQVIQPIENGMTEILNKQDGLYHVILKGMQGGNLVEEKRLITCIANSLNPYENYQEYLKLGENPDLEFIFSNTTEAGIYFDQEDQDYDRLPQSFPGKITALLFHRFNYFKGDPGKGLIIIPCELIDKNGATLKEAILKYSKLWNLSPGFEEWIRDHNIFCNSLVDRIVPGFPKENIKEIREDLGYDDNLVVMAEPFHLWVIEAPDSVKAALPAEKVGLQVKIVKDLSPYRTRKVRILNGAHTAMVPVAYLNGLSTVKEAVEDEDIGIFIKEAIFEEIVPTLNLPENELNQFSSDVMERFQNPFIRHELISIALNSISKYKVRVLPSVLEFIKRKNQPPDRLLYALAALIYFYKGEWKGKKIPLHDTPENVHIFQKAWQRENIAEVVDSILSNKILWELDLTQIPGIKDTVTRNLEKYQRLERI
ncbi:tagaturonate reductase [soil metagenome]